MVNKKIFYLFFVLFCFYSKKIIKGSRNKRKACLLLLHSFLHQIIVTSTTIKAKNIFFLFYFFIFFLYFYFNFLFYFLFFIFLFLFFILFLGAFIKFKEDGYEIGQVSWRDHPYYLPNFTDVFNFSLPFLSDFLSDIFISLIKSESNSEISKKFFFFIIFFYFFFIF